MKRLTLIAAATTALLANSAVNATAFSVTNLVTDDQTVNAAQITDSGLKNAWGISYGPTSPFWVSSNGAGTSPLYGVNPATNVTTKIGLTVAIPGAGNVTGQVFNGGVGFNGNLFLFASEDGTVSGWRPALNATAETLVPGSANNVYKGVARALVGNDAYLYAANFHQGTIDVHKGSALAPNLTGNFTDPNLPAGFAPFNTQNLNDKIYVTYAVQDAAKHDDVAGLGNGLVDVFDVQGNLLNRVARAGTLNSPWGLAIAPASFGEFAGDLLVGNFGDGTINVFDLTDNSFDGQLKGPNGQPLTIDGLWGLIPGNGGGAGSTQSIYFAAGPNGEAHALFGVIAPAAVPVTINGPAALMLGLGIASLASRRRKLGYIAV